jgi:hypothetical protein
MRREIVAVVVVLAAVLAMGSSAYATITIGGITYVNSGLTESITVPFTMPDAAISTQTYADFVTVKVTGTGQSDGTCWNDAFWVFTDPSGAPVAPANGSGGYQLNFDTSTLLPSIPFTQNAAQQIYFDLDSGCEIFNRPYYPMPTALHEYNLALKVGSFSSHLHFGVCDGVFGDNTGAYHIEVTQLTPIPEPSTFVLVIVGGLCWLTHARRRRPPR